MVRPETGRFCRSWAGWNYGNAECEFWRVAGRASGGIAAVEEGAGFAGDPGAAAGVVVTGGPDCGFSKAWVAGASAFPAEAGRLAGSGIRLLPVSDDAGGRGHACGPGLR